MSTYRIGELTLAATDSRWSAELARVHGTKPRPRCLCQPDGIEVYVAKVNGHYIIKRMPNSGETHAPSCDSYEPPLELSGLGEVVNLAIQENVDDGTTTLKLDFPLSKIAGRAPPAASGVEKQTVRTDGKKLTLRGVLHYLWDQAGFNKWSPAMEGKRSWYVIRKYLLDAASDKTTKGRALSDILYIPEPFTADKKDEIQRRRQALLAGLAAPSSSAGTSARPLMIVIGQIKEIGTARYGHKIVLKHLPDFLFMISDDLHNRMARRFQAELGLWNAYDEAHLLMIGTFSLGPTGIASLEELALMNVTAQWIPFENSYDKAIIDELTRNGRRFVRGLRYNMAASRPLAFAVLADTRPLPTALYIEPPGAAAEYRHELDALIQQSKLASWRWSPESAVQPALPASHRTPANHPPA